MARRSLASRLVAVAAAWISAALVIGGIALSALFHDAVRRTFDARLDVLLEGLVAVTEIGADGAPNQTRGIGEPRFEQPYSGWYWQISDGGTVLARSRSLWDDSLPSSHSPAASESARRNLAGPEDQTLRVAERDIALPGRAGRLRFLVAGDLAEIAAARRAFNVALAWSLGLLGAGLLLAVVIQVRYGLVPLRRLRQAIVAIRTGSAQRLEGEFPSDIAPLSDELNVLIEQNARVLERARTQVSNLAHGLKTPLAVLANEADGVATPLAEVVRRQTALMRDQVDHHLARARTAAAAGVLGTRTEVRPVVEGLRRTLARLYQDRAIAITDDVADGLSFRGERQDLEEMLGNLADNACKWAAGRVAITATRAGDRLVCTVDDDGPGLAPDQLAAVFGRGTRLDESVPGSGHGLAIVRDIADLYGGSIALAPSPLGGLRATLTLPRAPAT